MWDILFWNVLYCNNTSMVLSGLKHTAYMYQTGKCNGNIANINLLSRERCIIKYHNSSGILRAGSIRSTQFTQKLAQDAWYCLPPYISLCPSILLEGDILRASTSNRQTPQARSWVPSCLQLNTHCEKLRHALSGCNNNRNNMNHVPL